MKKIFPQFMDDKDRTVNSDRDVDIELEPGTDSVIEEESIPSKKFNKFFYLLLVIVFLGLFLKLFNLQVVFGEKNRQKAEENRLRIRVSIAPRGIIYDRKKAPLVKNIASFSIEVYPNDLPTKKQDREEFYQKLSQIVNLPLPQVQKIDEKRNTQEPIVLKENLSQDEAILFESKIVNLPATKVVKKPQREYLDPKYSLSFILGYTGKITEEELKEHSNYTLTDNIGKSGLEESYEQFLKGEDEKQRLEVDSQGKVARILDSVSGKLGDSLVLSVDLGLQEQMVNSLDNMIKQTKVKNGVALAANPNTGEILGMVSLPSYDNNLFAKGIKQEEYQKLIQNEDKLLFNRAIAANYPPGSIIKPVIASAGLQEGVITKTTTISDPGIITITNKYNPSIVYNFPDWKPGGHGRVDIYKALEQSCDIFFYSVGGGWRNIKGLGAEKLSQWFSKFNLDKKTGVDLSGENEGFVPTVDWKEKTKKETWGQGDSYHVAIGQGDLTVTPIEILDYTMFFANGGKLIKPHLVSEIDTAEGQLIKKIEPEITASDFVSKDNIAVVREGMRAVITQGTARSLSDLPFSVAGKTGTAQNPHGEPHGWFIAFAPYENPQIAVVVLLENGGEGTTVAAPVAKEILQYWYNNMR